MAESTSAIGSTNKSTSELVTPFLRYLPDFGVIEKNIIDLKKARSFHAEGKQFTLLFGPKDDPEYYITLNHSIEPGIEPGFSVNFMKNGVDTCSFYFKLAQDSPSPDKNTFLHEFNSDWRDEQGRTANIHVHRALGVGDLPEIEFYREVWYNISVPVEDFYFGPFPGFDELVDGSFVSQLPKITMPPEHLLVEHIPIHKRTAKTPKRRPIGRFPW